MSKCDCYRLEPEQHYFVDKYGTPIYENINVPRCWGTKDKDMCDVLQELDKALDGYDGIECDYRRTQNIISVHDVGDETHPLKQWYCYADCNRAYVTIGKKYKLIPIRHYRGDALGGPEEVAFVTSEVYDEWLGIMKSFAILELNNK